jgi:hypothetical protein
LFFGRRVITQGAWTQLKQPAWESMPALDVRKLSAPQLARLAESYPSLADKKLEALAQLKSDPVRGQIDSAISNILNLPDLSPIRELLDREPGLTAIDISPREVQPSFDTEDEDDVQAELV